MTQKETIFEELTIISPVLTTLNRSNLFIVPQGYFEGLTADIIARIKREALLAGAKSNTFTIPENYFETFSGKILSKINNEKNEFADELEKIAPLLNTISKKNIYAVPENYFENFSITKNKKQAAKIISFGFARKWISYAAAAIIGGVLITGGFLYQNKQSSFNVTEELNNISDSELNAYIENDSLALSTENSFFKEQELPDIKQSLSTVSDEELQQYLNDHSEVYAETPSKTN
ncbi:MAG TPA: hypothetical protein VHP12_04235 [Chitinophagaceae bacterium]|nr:hypothetical protein [Chitinophagaceae bacterium]